MFILGRGYGFSPRRKGPPHDWTTVLKPSSRQMLRVSLLWAPWGKEKLLLSREDVKSRVAHGVGSDGA